MNKYDGIRGAVTMQSKLDQTQTHWHVHIYINPSTHLHICVFKRISNPLNYRNAFSFLLFLEERSQLSGLKALLSTTGELRKKEERDTQGKRGTAVYSM